MAKTDYVTEFIVKEKGPNVYVWFNDIDSIIRCLEQDPENIWFDYPYRDNNASYADWAGAKSMEDAKHKLLYGWEEIADDIYLEDAALMANREIEPEFIMHMDYTGGAVDIGAYVAGVPECMVSFETQLRKKKTVSILFNICSSAGSSKKQIMERGHTVTCICDYLERSGYRVRIDVADTAYGFGDYYSGKRAHWTLAFCAKDYAQPLDFGRIGYMLGSPAMLRRIFFGIEGSSQKWRSTIGSTMGTVAPVHASVGNQYDYVFDYGTPITVQSANKCIEYIVTGKSSQIDITDYEMSEDEF